MFRCPSSAVAVALFAVGCSAPQTSRLDDQARAYVRLAVALGEHDPDSLDFYAGPDELAADVRQHLPSLAATGQQADALATAIVDDSPRARELASSARLIAARVQVLHGAGWTYERERQVFFGLEDSAPDAQALADVRANLDALLATTLDGRGRLVDRFATAMRPLLVPADRWRPVLEAALDECRRRTRAHIQMPSDERVDVEIVADRPWAAYSRYRGAHRSVIQVNAGFQFTIDQLLQLACHEGYPGHHTRSVLLDDGRPERSVQLAFSPASMVSEGAAMAATEIAFSPDDRVQFEAERLAPLAGIPREAVARGVAIERLAVRLQPVQSRIAADYLDGRLEFARAVDAFEDRALVPHAEALVKYVNEYRSYVATYTDGARQFESRLHACVDAGEDRWQCYQRAMR
jgi:hypothetical protein